MNKQLYREIVRNKPYLFWGVGDKTRLSDEAVVEAVLNFGDFDDVRKLCDILGMENVADIFNRLTGRSRLNFKKPTLNFFRLYFARHVSGYSKR